MTNKEQELLEKIKNTNPIYLYKDFKVNPGRKGKIMDSAAFNTGWQEFCDRRGVDIYEIFYEDYFKKDQKITFDFENVEDIEAGKTSCGVPWILYMAGGDWELPVYFFIYPGEKGEPRMYIPTRGNVFHKKIKTAFGEEDPEDIVEGIIEGSGLGQGYKKGEIRNVIVEICNGDDDYYSELIDTVDYNTDWMKDEFDGRIIGV